MVVGYPLCCGWVLVHRRCRRFTDVRSTFCRSDRTIDLSLVLLVRLLEESKSGKQALREVRMKHLLSGGY